MADKKPNLWNRMFGRRSKESINEAQMNMKPVPEPDSKKIDGLDKDNTLIDQLEKAEGISYASLNDFTSLAERRDQRYVIYDQMRQNDSLASAALEMYADDITLPDPSGRAIWVESENANIVEAGNRLLRVLKIESDIWALAYSLICYGDVYLELFRDESQSTLFCEGKNGKWYINEKELAKLSKESQEEIRRCYDEAIKVNKKPTRFVYEEYIERVNDPSELFDLVTRGQTVGFVRTHINENKTDTDGWNNFYNNYSYRINRNDVELYDSQKFVHLYVPDAGVRHPYKFVLDTTVETGKDGDTKITSTEFTVSTGKSLLQDAYKTSQQLQLAENSILLSRLTRASIYRLIQVNIGSKSEKDALSLLQRIKTLLDKKTNMDTKNGGYGSYANPGPEVSNIILPVKENGQGGVSTSVIGGDYDPKALTDIDYLVNKELAAFKIPRQFLNFTDGGGFNGGSSLAKISSQYAHRIVRYKRALTTGITTLLNIFFSNKNPDYVGNFEVKMTPITTVEDSERVEMARSKLEMVSQIMDQLESMEDTIGKFEILKDAFEDAYPNSVVSQVLSDYIKKLKNPPVGSDNPPTPPEGDGGDSFASRSSGGSSFSSGGDLGSGDDSFANDSSDGGGDDSFANDSSDGSDFPTDLSGEGIDLTDTDAVDDILGDEEQ